MQKTIIAAGPVIVENGQALLDKHGDTNFWKFCGGQMDDFNLSLAAAAQKRAKEELGIDTKILNEQPFITFARKEKPEGVIDVILVHFLAEREGEIKPGPDIREWAWLDIDNLPSDLAPNIIPALKHFGFLK